MMIHLRTSDWRDASVPAATFQKVLGRPSRETDVYVSPEEFDKLVGHSCIKSTFRDEALVIPFELGDCTLGGVSSGKTHLSIMAEIGADFVDELSNDDRSKLADIVKDEPNACAILLRKPCGQVYPTVVPLARWLGGAWTMDGGNKVLVWGSPLSERYPGPLPVHDRIE